MPKSHMIGVRLNKDQRQLLNLAAKKQRKTVSEWLRELGLETAGELLGQTMAKIQLGQNGKRSVPSDPPPIDVGSDESEDAPMVDIEDGW